MIEKKQRQIELLQEKRAALISHAVTKGLDPNAKMKPSGIEWLGDVPKHWQVLTIRRFASVDQGHTFPNSLQGNSDGTIPFYKVQDMNLPGNEIYMYAADNYINYETLDVIGATKFPAGTVIFPRVGAALLTNKRRILSSDALFDENVYGVIPRRADSIFLYFVLSLIDLASLCSPGLVPTVTIPAIKNIAIPYPEIHEQKSIADYLQKELSKTDRLLHQIQESIKLLLEYRTALISAAVTGNLDVRKARL